MMICGNECVNENAAWRMMADEPREDNVDVCTLI